MTVNEYLRAIDRELTLIVAAMSPPEDQRIIDQDDLEDAIQAAALHAKALVRELRDQPGEFRELRVLQPSDSCDNAGGAR